MIQERIKEIRENIKQVIIGKEHIIDLLITAIVAGGHVLLEDVPGTGKTVLAKTIAKSVSGQFSRIQFTPDLLPSDVTGLNYYNRKEDEFVFRPGPAFCHILLADEINRATPRTQAGLLECMEEKQITIDGETRTLPEPFFVIATQNPVETAGTFPLPEAQLDRFMMKLSMGMPSREEEILIMNRFLTDSPAEKVEEVCDLDSILQMRKESKNIFIHPSLMEYIAELVTHTRQEPQVLLGVSPRGTLAFINALRAYAMILERDFVIPEDVKDLAEVVLAHRLVLKGGVGSYEQAKVYLCELLQRVTVPTEDWGKR